MIPTISEEQLQQVIDRFWETVPPTWHRIHARIQANAVTHSGMTAEQFQILRNIYRGVGSVSELAEARHISRPAVSQAVDGLVGKGLVERRQSTDDRRFVQLALTPAGEELLNAIFQKNRAWMMEKFAVLSPAEIDTLAEGMTLLAKVFED